MYRIAKDFAFSAAHHLTGLPPDHPCSRQHGHNYVVTLELASDTLNAVGFVRDYRALERFKHYIDSLDHTDLNEQLVPLLIPQTSAEHLARHFFDVAKCWYPEVVAVRVSETPKTFAEYRR